MLFFQNHFIRYSSIILQHMNFFHELLKKHNLTLVTSGVVSDENADLKPLIARMLVSKRADQNLLSIKI